MPSIPRALACLNKRPPPRRRAAPDERPESLVARLGRSFCDRGKRAARGKGVLLLSADRRAITGLVRWRTYRQRPSALPFLGYMPKSTARLRTLRRALKICG